MSLTWLDQKYLNLVSGQLRNFRRLNDRTYQFSCPICGDGTNKKKARAYIYDKKGDPRFHCHNCGTDMKFHRFIESTDAHLYGEYQMERITSGIWTPTRRQASSHEVQKSGVTIDLPVAEKVTPLDVLTSIDKLPEAHYARKFVADRLIPQEYWPKLFHCPMFYAWVNYFMPDKFSKAALKKDGPRLVIPFFDKKGNMHTFQGRIYKGESDAKYITIRRDLSIPKVYGLDTFDPHCTVYALEGPIDTMFIRNGVAFSGGDHSALTEAGFSPAKTTIVYDNEPRSPFTKRKMERALQAGFGVCIWPTDIVHKDVNKMIMEGMSIDSVRDIIRTRTFRGMAAEIELSAWSKSDANRIRKDRRVSLDRGTQSPRNRGKVSLAELFPS